MHHVWRPAHVKIRLEISQDSVEDTSRQLYANELQSYANKLTMWVTQDVYLVVTCQTVTSNEAKGDVIFDVGEPIGNIKTCVVNIGRREPPFNVV